MKGESPFLRVNEKRLFTKKLIYLMKFSIIGKKQTMK
jgi:hypothetical protein